MYYPPQQPLRPPTNPSVDRLDHPYITIDINNPPHTPQVDVPPPIIPYLPVISGLLALRIQERAEDTPLRTVIFNIAAENRFLNEFFTGMVEQVALDVYMRVRIDRQYDMIEDALEPAVTDTIIRSMASLYYDNQSIKSTLNPSAKELHALGKAYESLREFDQRVSRMAAGARVPQAHSMPTQPDPYAHTGAPMQYPPQYDPRYAPQYDPRAVAPPPPYDPRYTSPPPQPQMNYDPRYAPPYDPRYDPRAVAPAYDPRYAPQYDPRAGYYEPQRHAYAPGGRPQSAPAPGSYAHMQRPQPQYDPQGVGPESVMTRDYSRGSDKPSAPPVQESRGFGHQSEPQARQPGDHLAPAFRPRQTQAPIRPQPVPRTEPVEIKDTPMYEDEKGRYILHPFDGSYAWRPTLEQPHLPVWNRFTHEPHYRVYLDQDRVEIVLLDIEKEDNVEYEAHKTTRVLAHERLVATERAMTEEAKVTIIEEEILPEEALVPTHNQQLVSDDALHTSFDDVVTNAQIGRARFMADQDSELERPIVYTSDTHVLELLIAPGLTKEKVELFQSSITKLRNSSLSNASTRIEELAIQCKGDDAATMLVNQINERYTQAVNDALKYRLQITDIRIDSFKEDLGPLLVAITENYSEAFANSLRKANRWVATRVFGTEMTTEQTAKATKLISQRYGFAKATDNFDEAKLKELREKISNEGIFLFLRHTSVTLVDLTQDELEVKIPEDSSGAVMDALQPLLSKITTRILSDDEDDASSHVIITRDNKHMKITTGLLDTSYHLVY